MRRVVAWLLFAFALASSAAAIGLLVLMRGQDLPPVYGFAGKTTIYALICAVVGLAIALRRPGNAVAWIFLVSGVFAGCYELGEAYGAYANVVRHGAAPAGAWAAWVGSWAWIPTTTLAPTLLLLYFPDGQLPSPRWRPVAWFTVGTVAFFVLAIALLPGPMLEAGNVSNPASPFAEGTYSFTSAQLVFFVPLLVALAWCVTALVRRFQSSRGIERLQLKWFAYSASLTAIVLALVPFFQTMPAYQIVNVLSLDLLPLAAGVAILRYRLYDIDVLIHRTLVYGATTAGIAIAFFTGIVVLQAILRPLTSGSDVAVAASTLVSFALFQPLRRWIQGGVDRRFYRSRYDAAHTLEAFSVLLRDEVDLDAVRAELVDAVGRTVQPAHASLWLR